jgi:zinc/manganese transport system permease protein
MQLIALFWPAMALILLLVFIHVIFGLEIIKRGVIFTDLAIAQMAAMGLVISVGFLDGAYQGFLTLLFSVLGALLITYASRKLEHIEAFIGMIYALGASSIMILLANSPHGSELFSRIGAVDVLFVTPGELIIPSVLYGGMALLMFYFYPKTDGIVRELSFFVLLAFVVTSSVQLAGVLVVFSLLVAPALVALSQKRYRPIYVAWGSGLLLSVFAVAISYHLDLPTGYSIVFFQSLGVLVYLLLKPSKR